MQVSVHPIANVLAWRVFARSVAALLLLLTATLLWEFWQASKQRELDAQADLVRRVDAIEPNIIQALWRIDPDSIRVALQSIGSSPGVARASIRAQFRVSDIDERFEHPKYTNSDCSETIVRDYSTRIVNGLEIGSGTLGICFSSRLIGESTAVYAAGQEFLQSIVVACIMALILFFLVSRSIMQPLAQVIGRVREGTLLSDSALRRDRWDRRDEIDELFHQLVERERLLNRSHQDEKLRMMGVLASGVGHDFNNVLGVIMGGAELANLTAKDEATKGHLASLLRAARTGAAMTRRLQFFSRRTHSEAEVSNLHQIVDASRSFTAISIAQAVEIEFSMGLDTLIFVDPGGLEAALLNLILNAGDAVAGKPDGFIKIVVKAEKFEGRDYACVAVTDNGSGISPENLARVREPFFSTKGGKGSGLGLVMVQEFVASCNGRMDIESEPGQLTSVRLCFPVVHLADDQSRSRLPEADARFDRSQVRVLIVDDEVELARTLAEQLKLLGYQSDWASDPVQLMQQVAMVGRQDVIVSDVYLGPIGGKDLYDHFVRVLGDTCPKVIFMSGAVLSNSLEQNLEFLRKPFNVHVLDRKIIEVLK